MGGQCHAPAALPQRKTRYPLYRRLGGPQSRSGRVRKILLQPGFDPRTKYVGLSVFILIQTVEECLSPGGSRACDREFPGLCGQWPVCFNRYRHCWGWGWVAVFVHTANCQTPWSRVDLEKLAVPYLAKKFLEFCGSRGFSAVFTTSRYLSLS